jgi:hypothetical protein
MGPVGVGLDAIVEHTEEAPQRSGIAQPLEHPSYGDSWQAEHLSSCSHPLDERGQHRFECIVRFHVLVSLGAIAEQERGSRCLVAAEHECAGPKGRRRSVREVGEVQSPVLRSGRRRLRDSGRRVIRTVEQPAFPLVAVATGKGGQAAAGDPGLELTAVEPLITERLGDRATVGDRPVRVKVQGDPCSFQDGRAQQPSSTVTPSAASMRCKR